MITRDALTTTTGYAAACQSAPPPLHVYDLPSRCTRTGIRCGARCWL
jgi:hypothetical protein